MSKSLSISEPVSVKLDRNEPGSEYLHTRGGWTEWVDTIVRFLEYSNMLQNSDWWKAENLIQGGWGALFSTSAQLKWPLPELNSSLLLELQYCSSCRRD